MNAIQAQAAVPQVSRRKLRAQWRLASGSAVKLWVREAGWYRVGQAELLAAGLDPGVDPRRLKLYAEGQEQPMQVEGERDGRLDPGDGIEFFGVGLDTPSTDQRVYWLTASPGRGQRVRAGKGRGAGPVLEGFPHTVVRRDRTIYFAALKNGDDGNFFGPVVAGEPVDQNLTVHHLNPPAGREAFLEVSLQGATAGTHRVSVLLNGQGLGEVVFEGQSRGEMGFPIPQGALAEGDNTVTLQALDGEADVSLLDETRLTYWHSLTAEDDSLGFTAPGGSQATINGFTSPDIRVVDVTDPGHVRELFATVAPQGDGFSVTVRVPGRKERRLLAFAAEKARSPSGIMPNQPSSWHGRKGGADMVMVAPGEFLGSLSPLKELRESQGLSVALVDVEDVYDEFSFGRKDPRAIKAFVDRARSRWRTPPRFLLLVGDASLDPRDYMGMGDWDLVPTKLVDTAHLETASDDWFGDEDGDGVAEVAVGRLPVRSEEEAAAVVSKIVGYDRGAGVAATDVLLVADQNDEFDFEGASAGLAALIPAGQTVQAIFRGQMGSEPARAALLGGLDNGPVLVNYMGHGSVGIWRGGLFSSPDAATLTNGPRLPLVLSMTCLNGMFQDLYAESLGEALLKAPAGGAVAVWASSGLTQPSPQAELNREMVRLLFEGNGLTLGEAAAWAKASVSNPDVRNTWILLGDPATVLK
jgi:hypothetical protein